MSFQNVPINSSKPTRGGGFRASQTGKSGFSTTAGSVQTKLALHKVSEAKEFESFRHIPKYTKPYLAVIHPSPLRHRPSSKREVGEFELEGSPAKFAKKENNRIEIPEHLMKAPAD